MIPHHEEDAMRAKLKLNLEQLTIDSFDTAAPQKPKGTVFGEQCTCWTQCGQNTCPGCPTCDYSCNGTCNASCNGTCNCPTANTCDWSCYATDCGYGYTCGNCTAYQTNCNEICH
jgi:hypothetical protein